MTVDSPEKLRNIALSFPGYFCEFRAGPNIKVSHDA
jgi:hypothetical protein